MLMTSRLPSRDARSPESAATLARCSGRPMLLNVSFRLRILRYAYRGVYWMRFLADCGKYCQRLR